ncbi:M16 family metallopeptidase [Rodentibacter haemolyticus]|uniref:Insulinase family protein n=1 Tax=Rodentibacter haemolyticus TaxID=2778911 RepID=A0ABX6UY24_9PAST|nr:M16 family metallopeptidase [Rodentibacter haemolyticus]QPB43002.1 insulinase family protein [Rodentibacter haemolyticus]
MRNIFYVLLFLFSTIAAAGTSMPIQGQLENGLRYTILPLHSQPRRVDVIMRVYAGAIDEAPAQSGVAHMVEHMAFRATESYVKGIMPYLHQQGWLRGKNYNAFTNQENTTYIYMPPKHFSLTQTLEVVKQMLFKAQVNASDWENERKIILEEWRTRDSARRRLFEQRQTSQRFGSRYENRTVIGSQKSINTMPVAELQQYYQTWYVPNNMQLLLVGDIQVNEVEKLIKAHFSDLPKKQLPIRDKHYYEPKLIERIKVDRLSDPQNNNSQVSYLWRFDDHISQEQTEIGFKQRLIDQLAVNSLNQRFREEKNQMPSDLSSLSVRKIPVGKITSALIFTANVEKQSHRIGANYMIEQSERLKHYPITQSELDKQKEKILSQQKNDKANQQNFTFEDWVQTMISTLLNEKNYYSQAQIEKMTKDGIDKISLSEVNQRIQYWLNASDQILQYMPPLNIEIPPIELAEVKQWRQMAKQGSFNVPTESAKEKMTFAPLKEQGSIVKEQRFPEQNTVRWTLSNGDIVVWLKSPIAKNKSYFVAQNQVGSNASILQDWKGKLAIQLIGNNAPLNWKRNQMLEWKENNHIPLIIRQSFDKLNILSTVENDKFADLLRFYYAQQKETTIKEEFEKTKREAIWRIELQSRSDEFKRNLAWETFVYGHPLNSQPTIKQIEVLTETELMQQWQALSMVPVTYFIMNDMEESKVRSFLAQNLAAIERGKTIETEPLKVQAGQAKEKFAMNPEPKDNVYISWFTQDNWDAKKALVIEFASSIASEKLSKKMRDETLGIYSKRFKSRLQAETNRIQTTLTFSSNPEITDKLIKIAKQVLIDLPNSITAEEFETAKSYFYQTEESGQQSPEAWLERLIYSENRFHTPQYLTEIKPIVESITLDEVKLAAKYLYNPENQRVFITTPKTPKN